MVLLKKADYQRIVNELNALNSDLDKDYSALCNGTTAAQARKHAPLAYAVLRIDGAIQSLKEYADLV